MTDTDIIDLRTWSRAKRNYATTSRARHTRWEDLTPRQRQMLYSAEKRRGRIG